MGMVLFEILTVTCCLQDRIVAPTDGIQLRGGSWIQVEEESHTCGLATDWGKTMAM